MAITSKCYCNVSQTRTLYQMFYPILHNYVPLQYIWRKIMSKAISFAIQWDMRTLYLTICLPWIREVTTRFYVIILLCDNHESHMNKSFKHYKYRVKLVWSVLYLPYFITFVPCVLKIQIMNKRHGKSMHYVQDRIKILICSVNKGLVLQVCTEYLRQAF